MLYLPLLALAATTALAARSPTTTTTTRAAAAKATKAAPTAAASLVPTSQRTTEAQEAAIKDPVAECAPYYYEPVANVMPTFPPIWATANLSFPGVTSYDKAIFAALAPGIPQIAPRGTRAGDFTGVTYDPNADPDCWWTETRCVTPKLPGLNADTTRCEEPDTWGFTLDDGPNCSHNAYFDYLLSINQKATLFYIGSNVLDWPLEAQRGLTDGHEICSHTWSHPYMTSMTDEQAFAELYYSKKAIKDVLGITVRCVRMPYGDVDDRIRWLAQQLDMIVIQWEHDTFDYDWTIDGLDAVRKNYDAILALQANGTYKTQGTIVLSHEIDGTTMALSQEYLPQIRKQFTGGVMPVGVCMNNTEPYVEGPAYVYPNYAQYVAGTVSVKLAEPTAVTADVQLAISATATSSANGGGIRSAAPTTSKGLKATTTSTPSSSATPNSANADVKSGDAGRSIATSLMGVLVAVMGGATMLLVA